MRDVVRQAQAGVEQMETPALPDADSWRNAWESLLKRIESFARIVDKIAEVCYVDELLSALLMPRVCLRFILMRRWLGVY
jgi:hypothetical protein